MREFINVINKANTIEMPSSFRPTFTSAMKKFSNYFDKNPVNIDFNRLFSNFLLSGKKLKIKYDNDTLERMQAHGLCKYSTNEILLRESFNLTPYDEHVFMHEFVHFLIHHSYPNIDTTLPSWADEMMTEYCASLIDDKKYYDNYYDLINISKEIEKYLEPINPKEYFNGNFNDYLTRNNLNSPEMNRYFEICQNSHKHTTSEVIDANTEILRNILNTRANRLTFSNISLKDFTEDVYNTTFSSKIGYNNTFLDGYRKHLVLDFIKNRTGYSVEKDADISNALDNYRTLEIFKNEYSRQDFYNPKTMVIDGTPIYIARSRTDPNSIYVVANHKGKDIHNIVEINHGMDIQEIRGSGIRLTQTSSKYTNYSTFNINGVELAYDFNNSTIQVTNNPLNKQCSLSESYGNSNDIIEQIKSRAISLKDQGLTNQFFDEKTNSRVYSTDMIYSRYIDYLSYIQQRIGSPLLIHKKTVIFTGSKDNPSITTMPMYDKFLETPTKFKIDSISKNNIPQIFDKMNADYGEQFVLSAIAKDGKEIAVANFIKGNGDNNFGISINWNSVLEYIPKTMQTQIIQENASASRPRNTGLNF